MGAALILERDVELSELAQLLDEAGAAGGRVVLIRGEAGIGKSTLINRFVTDVEDRADTLLGACDDLLTPQPLAPIWDVARAMPSLQQALADGDRRAVMETLLGLLSRRPRPTVLVLEDTQWADEATLDLITFLGRRIGRANGLLLLTYRDVEVDTEHPLRQVIGELPQQNVARMSLNRLSPRAVSSLIDESTFDIEEIVALTGGNPLFVAEVLAAGTDRVPFSVRDAVLGRAAKVSAGARRLLEVVSVVPGNAERSLVDALAAPNDAQMAECQRQGLLVLGENSVAFAHDLQRRAIESSLTLSDRRRLNQEVLDALRGSADPARLVHHASEAGDLGAIAEFTPRAARAAMTIRSTSEAVAQFRRLEPHLGRIDIGERAAVLADWAWQEHQLDHPEAIPLFDRSIELYRETGDARRLPRVLTLASRANWSIGRTQHAIAYVEEAIALLEPHGLTADLALAFSQRAHLAFDVEDRDEAVVPLVDRAIAAAREVDDAEALVRALSVKGYLLYSRGDMTGMTLMEECLRVAERAGDQLGEVVTLSNMAGMFGDVRDVARAADFAQRARDTATRYDIRSIALFSQSLVAEYLLWRGEWDAAENAANEALAASTFVEGQARRVLVAILARRGRQETRAAAARMWSVLEVETGPSSLDPAASTMAEYLWLSGDDDPKLVARLREVLDTSLSLGRPWPSGPLAFWMWKLGLLDTVPEGTAESYRWMMNGEYRRAAQFWHARGIPYEEGLALMLGNEAEQVEAIRIFDDLGATAAANNVRRALAQQGARVPRGKSMATRGHPAGLTARQAEVLQLLADGLANAAIADELFVSHRTVENHVSAILMKLDVTTREDAVAAARERGLLPTG
jgi:DNA-binding CsgD family transcriptional regulator/tetratricopeptide (TPR) repeat protein/GTPase SAR1 family protein